MECLYCIVKSMMNKKERKKCFAVYCIRLPSFNGIFTCAIAWWRFPLWSLVKFLLLNGDYIHKLHCNWGERKSSFCETKENKRKIFKWTNKLFLCAWWDFNLIMIKWKLNWHCKNFLRVDIFQRFSSYRNIYAIAFWCDHFYDFV